MLHVWIASDNITSPLGATSEENYMQMRQGNVGVRRISDSSLSDTPFFASAVQMVDTHQHSRLESLAIQSVGDALRGMKLSAERTLFILSTTKGNINFLDGLPEHPRLSLHAAARYIAHEVGLTDFLVVSNACISGLLGLIVGRRYLLSGKYDHVVVTGVDILSRFVISGFQSLHAISDEACRPFDKQRKGISLGEAAATVVLTTQPKAFPSRPSVIISGGGLSNDANHISGPSRTGEELGFSIEQALQEAGIGTEEIDFISAHGTGTVYNDEMEAKAFTLKGLHDVPVNSLKGYIGHTLGAAGVLETVISTQSLYNNEILASAGFSEMGVSGNIHIADALTAASLRVCLKTASGFGGCNAAIVLSKQESA